MTEQKIARINELYHKSKAEGLTEEEAKEQAILRQEYIASIKGALLGNIDRIDVVDSDGKVEPLANYKTKKDLGNE